MTVKILLIEDDRDVGDFYEAEIGDYFACEIIRAANGKIGLAHTLDTAFAIIITDYAMPLLTGLEIVQQIRKNSANPNFLTPIILITGFKEEFIDDVEAFELLHITDKPIDMAALVAKIAFFAKIALKA